tara:strand:+ start:1387 stop:1710 length:324 start_codon:yes stop_codon:yes gene_type:complete
MMPPMRWKVVLGKKNTSPGASMVRVLLKIPPLCQHVSSESSFGIAPKSSKLSTLAEEGNRMDKKMIPQRALIFRMGDMLEQIAGPVREIKERVLQNKKKEPFTYDAN